MWRRALALRFRTPEGVRHFRWTSAMGFSPSLGGLKGRPFEERRAEALRHI
jgi:hypothetical protein